MKFDSISLKNINSRESTIVKTISRNDIAIIGIGLEMPMGNEPNEYWNSICNKEDSIKKFSDFRKRDVQFLNHIIVNNKEKEIEYRDGGYLSRIDCFDYDLFKLTPKEASLMDPNQRMFLQTAFSAIDDAGYGNGKLSGSKTSVYVGSSNWPIYGQIISRIYPELEAFSTTGNVTSIIASRLSYILDLKGPAMMVDTACSSSLVAIHQAYQSIRNGESDLAIAGGVKLDMIPVKKDKNIGIHSSDFKTKTFDDSSDGTGWGEGIGAILLKPLDDAIKDRDHIYAVIKGSAINQDGKSIGITAPNVNAQEDVIIQAWESAGINPETIEYIEAHGTGTKLGDPIEIEGIKRAFEKYTKKKQFCAIGSVKTNIGHLDDASGIAGIIKAILALENKKIPPTINFQKPNREIFFTESPVYVSDTLRDWKSEYELRRCGVSSFGISGTNCHVVLEEAPTIVNKCKDKEWEAITFSARKRDVLNEIIDKYIKFFMEDKNNNNISDICYTRNTGYSHHELRLAIVFNSKEDLITKLKITRENQQIEINSNGIFLNKVKTEVIKNYKMETLLDEYLRQGASEEIINKIASLYVKGGNFDWEKFYSDRSLYKISLPRYPYEKKRCWLFDEQEEVKENIDCKKEYCEEKKLIKVISKSSDKCTSTEQCIANIWGNILGFDVIDIDAMFYEIGGDSLSAALIVPEINKELNVEVSLSEFLNLQSIKSIANLINSKNKKDISSIKSLPRKEFYETSSAQKRIYFLSQMDKDNTVYNQPNAFLIKGKLNIDKVRNVFKNLVNRHDVFKTTFRLVDGEIVQIVQNEVNFDIMNESNNNKSIDEFINEFVKPFDLMKAPLLRVKIVELNSNEYLFLYDIHHIICDGTSTNILISEFKKLYFGEELEELNIQYRDFAVWQNDLINNGKFQNQCNYWSKEFYNPIPLLNIPTDFKRTDIQTFACERVNFFIKKTELEKLNELAKQENCTLYMVMLACFYILLWKYCGQDDLVIGTPVIGRTQAELRNVIGMFTNTLAIRSKISEEFTFIEYLRIIKDKVLSAIENQEYQFDDLVNVLKVPRIKGRHPLFDVMFVYENFNDNMSATRCNMKSIA